MKSVNSLFLANLRKNNGPDPRQTTKVTGRTGCLNRQQFAAVDETAGWVVGRASSRAGSPGVSPHRECNPAMNCFWQRFQGQRVADFETFRQVTEQGGAFPGQHAGQPMSHAGQDGVASALALELRRLQRSTSPERMLALTAVFGDITGGISNTATNRSPSPFFPSRRLQA